MLVMPSDQVIPSQGSFKNTVLIANNEADNGNIITFGIAPTSPETGFGYLELSNNNDANKTSPCKLKSFVEKPNLDMAKQMIKSGNYMCNAGIFLFKVKTILEAFEKYANEMKELVTKAMNNCQTDLGYTH